MEKWGFWLTIISAVLFGCNPLLSKIIYFFGGTPTTLVFFRLLMGSIGMAVINYFVYRDGLSLSWKQLKKMIICSLFFSLTPLFLWSSYHYLPSGVATTINFSYPTLVLIGSYCFYHQHIGKKEMLSCFLSMIGIACFCQVDGAISFKGIAIAFLSAITFALYILYLANSGLMVLNPYKLNFWISFLGAIEILVVNIVTHDITLKIQKEGWLFIIILAVLSGIIASTAFQQGTKMIGAQKASLLSTFEPLTSIVIGIEVFQEKMTVHTGIGIVLVLMSILLLAINTQKERNKI